MKFKSLKFLLFIFFLMPSIAFANVTIKYLDMNILMNQSLAGKDIIKKLTDEKKKYLDSFKKTEENFKKEELDILAKRNILEKNKLQNKIEILNTKVKNHNDIKSKKLIVFQKKTNKAKSELIKIINIILVDYAQKNSISILLKKDSIILGQSELDITQDILVKVNEKISKVNIN